jgi:carboxyl-terminal processing protease
MIKKSLKTILLSSIISASVANASTPSLSDREATEKAIQKLFQTIHIVEDTYVDKISTTEIINKAIDGLLSNLDPHSSFLDKKHLEDLNVSTKGEFGGVGFVVSIKDKAITVVSPIYNTPADKAGIEPGDIILKIDDISTISMSLDKAVSLMRGKPGTDIVLTIIRKGELKPIVMPITRAIIKVDSVYNKSIENHPNVFYSKVTTFDKNVTTDVFEGYKKFIEKNKSVDGIILDLRNNGGGLLSQAISLVDMFVDKGVIVSQKGKLTSENISYNSSVGFDYTLNSKHIHENSILDIPLIVLVNSGSASASEIVSGSLQDLKRGLVIGTPTFGKGSVQSIMRISNDEALKITIARYFLSSGRTIQGKGVIPNIEIIAGKVPSKVNAFSIKEKDLSNHLKSELNKLDSINFKKISQSENTNTINPVENKMKELIKSESKDNKKTPKKNDKLISSDDVLNDIQLKSAIDFIKVLSFTK